MMSWLRSILEKDGAHHFAVEMDNLWVARFQEVSGLSCSIEAAEDIKEGGLNSSNHRFVKRATYGDITFKKGLINLPELYWWMTESALNSWPERRNGSIILLDQDNSPRFTWYFFRALPVKWEGPSLNSMSSSIAIESMTIAVEWLSLMP